MVCICEKDEAISQGVMSLLQPNIAARSYLLNGVYFDILGNTFYQTAEVFSHLLVPVYIPG